MRTGLVALGAFLILSQATNAADMKPRPRPMPKPAATESRTVPPQQQQMLFEEFLEWLRQRRR